MQAGRRVWAALAWPYDDFAGGDGAALAGRQPPVGEGRSWTKETFGSSEIVRAGNQNGNWARPSAGTGEAVYTLDWKEADARLGFIYRCSSSGGSGVALRFVNQWDYLRVRFTSTGTLLEDITWGFATTLRKGDALAAGTNYYIELELHGGSVRLLATDLDGGTAERKEILDGGGNAGNLSATRHGLWHDGSSAAASDRWAEFGGWRSLCCGSLETIAPGYDRQLGEICRLAVRDDLALLEKIPLFQLLSGRNLTSGVIANRILTWSGFNANHRQLDGGATLVATEPRALWGLSAARALAHLQREEAGRIYQDGNGYLRLEAAGHRRQGPHATARATLEDGPASGPYFSRLEQAAGNGQVEGAVTFRYHQSENKGLQEIWRLRDKAAIPAGQSRDFLAESGSYDVVDLLRTPAATTDYAGNSRADGQGSDLTASLTVSLPHAAGSGGAGYRGKGTLVRVENRHATATIYLTLLRLRADRAYQDYEPTSYRAEVAAAERPAGARSRLVDCRFIDNYAAARQQAEARLSQRKTPRTRLTLTLPNGGGENLAQITHRALSDRVKVVCPSRGINGDFFIEGIELEATAGSVTARWLVESIAN